MGTGLLGGYTTFSTASVETVRLLQQRRYAASLGYGLGVLVLSVAAALLGLRSRHESGIRRGGSPGLTAGWRAASAATQASIAHFTRAVYLETPPSTTASPSSSSSGSIRPFERIATRNASMRTCSSSARQPGARSARIDADDCEIAHPSPSQRIRSMRSPSRCSWSVTSSPQVGLIWCEDAAAPVLQPLRVRAAGEVEDDLLVQVPEPDAHARTPKNRTASWTPSSSTSTS